MTPIRSGGRVVVVGSINMDLVVKAHHVPAPGETVLGESLSMLPGGKGANQAVAASRVGATVAMVGRIGNDAFGQTLRDGLRAEGINTEHIGICKHDPSGVALITLADGGENSIVVAPGANALLRKVHIDDAFATFADFDSNTVMLMQLEIPLEVVLHSAQKACAAGWKVVLNPAPAQPLADELLACVDIIVVNESEAEILGGLDVIRSKVATVVATLGERGLAVYTSDSEIVMPGLHVNVVDTTGAGDATCGVLAAALASGHSIAEASDLSNRAGALTTTGLGARTSPTSTILNAFN